MPRFKTGANKMAARHSATAVSARSWWSVGSQKPAPTQRVDGMGLLVGRLCSRGSFDWMCRGSDASDT